MALGGSGNINNMSGSGNLSNLNGQTPMSNFFSCEALAACDVIVNIQNSITELQESALPLVYDAETNIISGDLTSGGYQLRANNEGNNVYGLDIFENPELNYNSISLFSTNLIYSPTHDLKSYIEFQGDYIYLAVNEVDKTTSQYSGDYLGIGKDDITLSWLKGAGTRMVVADANGALSTQAIPTVDFSNVTITGGTINGTPIGATNPSTIRATSATITSLGDTRIGYSVNGVITGSDGLKWNHSNSRLFVGGSPVADNARLVLKTLGTTVNTFSIKVERTNGTVIFGVDDAGAILANNGNYQQYNFAGSNLTTPSQGGSNVVFRNLSPGAASYFNLHADTFATQTGGESHLLRLRNDFLPTSGNADVAWLYSAPSINQTGGASGKTRSIYLKPTLTNAADYRAIEIDLASAVHDAIRVVGINSRIYTNGHLTVDGLVKLGSYTTTQRDALTVSNGQIIYNSTTNKFQGRAGGAWVDLH